MSGNCRSRTNWNIIDKQKSLQISWGAGETEFGICTIAWLKNNTICYLAFNNIENSLQDLMKLLPNASFNQNDPEANKLIQIVFLHNSNSEFKVGLIGSEFQIKIWAYLCKMPDNITMNYQALALDLFNNTNYTRAVATAVARNNIAFLVPCHRIISKSGELHKYRWGKHIKKMLLNKEQKTPDFDSYPFVFLNILRICYKKWYTTSVNYLTQDHRFWRCYR